MHVCWIQISSFTFWMKAEPFCTRLMIRTSTLLFPIHKNHHQEKRKEATPGEVLFGSNSSLLSAVYGGDDSEDDAWDDATLMDNQRFKKLCRLPQLGVYVDEAHHLFGADLENKFAPAAQTKPVSATRSTCWLLIPRLLRATTTQVHHM